jgi:hypothetical protein
MRSFNFRRRADSGKQNDADTVEPMLCTCDDDHPHRPEGRKGCGAYWNFIIPGQSA